MLSSSYYVYKDLRKKKNQGFFTQYYSGLSGVQDVTQLNDLYKSILNRFNPESDNFQLQLTALNQAHKQIYHSLLWINEYIKKIRLCLISQSELFKAFRSTGNLHNHVTLPDLINELSKRGFNEQLNNNFLKVIGRPTSIRIAIHFYSIPISFIQHFHRGLMNHSDPSDTDRKHKNQCDDAFEKCCDQELELFYETFHGNVANYLFHLLKSDVTDAILLLKKATISRDDLIELRDRIMSPSTQCNNKDVICQAANQQIAALPETTSEHEEVKVTVSARKQRR